MKFIFNFFSTKPGQYLALFLIVALGLSLRLVNLGQEAFWNDEILSLNIVQHYAGQLPAMVDYINSVEVHPVLYYLLLSGWTQYFGYGEFGVRLLSVIFGLGVIILTYFLANKLFNKQSLSLFAAVLVAVLPMQIEFSQEARPYIIYAFFALLSALWYWQYRQTKNRLYLLGYALAITAGAYLHYSYLFFAVSLAIFWLAEAALEKDKKVQAKAIISWLVVHAAVFVLFFWQAVAMLYKVLLGNHSLFGLSRFDYQLRGADFFETVFSQMLWLSKNSEITRVEISAVLLFKLALAIAVLWLLVTAGGKLRQNIKKDQLALIFVGWLTLAPVVLFFFSPQSVSYSPLWPRHVIYVSVFLTLLIAYVIGQFNWRLKWLLAALLATSLMNFSAAVMGNDSLWDFHHRWKIVAEHINQNYRPGDLILVQPGSMRSDFNHYLRPDVETAAIYPLLLFGYENDIWASRQTIGLIENESQIRQNKYVRQDFNAKMDYLVDFYQPTRIWLVGQEGLWTKQWFFENGWKVKFAAIEPLFRATLYQRQ